MRPSTTKVSDRAKRLCGGNLLLDPWKKEIQLYFCDHDQDGTEERSMLIWMFCQGQVNWETLFNSALLEGLKNRAGLSSTSFSTPHPS